MIKAIIWDMDGLLVDSEPLWQEAEIEVFGKLDVHLTREMCMRTKGLRIDEVVAYWRKQTGWEGPSNKEVQKRIIEELKRLLGEKGKAMPGVPEVLDRLSSENYPMALASSSDTGIIKTVLDKFNWHKYFYVICSGEHEEKGKPDPGIYHTAASKLNLNPNECLAVEDSYNGLLAAYQAGMFTVAVPDPEEDDQERFNIANVKLRALTEFTPDLLKQYQ